MALCRNSTILHNALLFVQDGEGVVRMVRMVGASPTGDNPGGPL